MRNLKALIVTGLLSASVCGAALGAPGLVSAPITAANFGWGGEGLYLTINGTDTTQGCSITNQLIISAADAQFKADVATVLTLLTTGLTSSIIVSGCYNNRPLVIAMGIAL